LKQYTRKEMREMMEVRGFSPSTITAYISHVYNLAEFSCRAPHTLTPEEIQKYQVFLVHEKQVSWSCFNQAVCAMRFFLTMVSITTGLSNTYHSKRNTKHSRLCLTQNR